MRYKKTICVYTEIKVVCKCFPGRHGDLPLQCSVGATLRGRPFLGFANHFMISIHSYTDCIIIVGLPLEKRLKVENGTMEIF